MVTAQQSFKISYFPNTVTVEATRGAGAEHLSIDRSSGAVQLEETGVSTVFSATAQRTFTAHGVLGVINLLRGAYLVLITGREAVGSIGGSTVFRVSETKIIKAASDAHQVSGTAAFDEARYLRLLSDALAAKSFYFSYDYDLTSSLQRQQLEKQRLGEQTAVYETASDEFFFTKFLAQPIIDAVHGRAQGSAFVLPVIHGFFECKPVSIRGTQFNYVLVTRRGRKRQGTRYFSRGADADGNVSNFAETEQIVDFAATSGTPELAGLQHSYVQIRGSIPIAWAQVINMKYVPTLKIDADGSRERFDKHLTNTIDMYGSVVAVNLVNKKKYEKPMGDAFARLSQEYKSPHYHYTHFDFHKECSKMRYDRLSLLTDELSEYMTRFGSFKTKQGEPATVQHGVVRTNCMDCLDRTNVVQTEFARSVLTKQLRDVGVFNDTDAIDAFPAFQSMLRNVWADNADAVSCAYSGTGALKTDFTRTGERTPLGALQDGRNSVERYVRGNFFDGERQDGIDLLLGHVGVDRNASPFADDQTLESKTLVGAVYLCLFMLVFAFFYPRGGHWFAWSNVVFTNSWLLVLVLVVRIIMGSHTAELLNWPRLSAYPFRPDVMRANASLSLPLLDRLFSSADAKAELRNDEINKSWPTTKKLA